jgi:leader peptidase (prepilin peptidase)/N-methyltransferase
MLESISLLYAASPATVLGFVFIFGALIGSFLNVVIYRLPVMMERDWQFQARQILELDTEQSEQQPFNLITPNSRCPKCQRPIKPWENIPILSYLLLKGECAGCGTGISIRYPTVELVTGLLSVAVVAYFGPTLQGFVLCFFTYALLAAAMIDYDTQLLPDDITLPLLWGGLIANYFGLLTTLESALWGAVIGYLSLWSVYQGFKLLTGKEGMGFGDFKLLAALGAWMGWQILPMIIILSSFAGAIIGGGLILFGRDKAKPIPFGPYLAIAGWIALVWGEQLTLAYLRWVG